MCPFKNSEKKVRFIYTRNRGCSTPFFGSFSFRHFAMHFHLRFIIIGFFIIINAFPQIENNDQSLANEIATSDIVFPADDSDLAKPSISTDDTSDSLLTNNDDAPTDEINDSSLASAFDDPGDKNNNVETADSSANNVEKKPGLILADNQGQDAPSCADKREDSGSSDSPYPVSNKPC